MLLILLAWHLTTMFSGSVNFSCDLQGPIDTRPSTWGTADYCIKEINFNHPVEVVSVRGDLVGWTRKQSEGMAGALVSLQDTSPEGSIHADWLQDSCFLYYQMPINRSGRLTFNDKIGRILKDGKLIVKMASFLNETAQPVHLEVTLVVEYREIR
jgi:hypothetical protein